MKNHFSIYFKMSHIYLKFYEETLDPWFSAKPNLLYIGNGQRCHDYFFWTNSNQIESIDSISNFDNNKFDIIIYERPHTLDSMITLVNLYSSLLTETGILLIEDVQSWEWISILTDKVPSSLRPYIHIYNLRPNKPKNRFDDIVFMINKRHSKVNI
jgi:hypothetical protein